MRICGLVGSLRRQSWNRALMDAAIEVAPAGLEILVWDRLAELPPYDQDRDREGGPEPVQDLKRAVSEADGLLIAMPEYNWGVPGVLKNAIDWVSRPAGRSPLAGKPAAIIGASTSISGTMRGQLQLRQNLVSTGSLLLPPPEVVVAKAPEKFDGRRLADEPTRGILADLLTRFEAMIAQHHQPQPG